MIATLLLILTLSVSAVDETAVDLSFTMDVESSVVKAGTEFVVDLGIDNNSGIACVRVKVEYDNTCVEFVKSNENAAAFQNISVIDYPELGYLYVTIGIIPDAIEGEAPIQTATDSVSLLTFKAKESEVDHITSMKLTLGKIFLIDADYNVGADCDYEIAEETVLDDIRIIGSKHTHTIEKVDAKAANCTENGWEAYEHCIVCDYTTFKEVVAPGSHDVVKHEGKPATCTEKGWEEYETCKRCDHTTYKEIAPLDHDIVKNAGQAATCTEKGWKDYDTCSRCDYTTYEEIAPLGHAIVNHEKLDPTCVDEGHEAYDTCERCDYTTFKSIPATGVHTTVAISVPVDPTCCSIGMTAGEYCTVCKAIIVAPEAIPATGEHVEATIAAVAPTCTASGLTEGKYCSECNMILVAQQVVEATGHTEEVIPAVDATCTTTGSTAGKQCSTCDAILEAPEVVEAKGHTAEEYHFKGEKCSVCQAVLTEPTSLTWLWIVIAVVASVGACAVVYFFVLKKKK